MVKLKGNILIISNIKNNDQFEGIEAKYSNRSHKVVCYKTINIGFQYFTSH